MKLISSVSLCAFFTTIYAQCAYSDKFDLLDGGACNDGFIYSSAALLSGGECDPFTVESQVCPECTYTDLFTNMFNGECQADGYISSSADLVTSTGCTAGDLPLSTIESDECPPLEISVGSENEFTDVLEAENSSTHVPEGKSSMDVLGVEDSSTTLYLPGNGETHTADEELTVETVAAEATQDFATTDDILGEIFAEGSATSQRTVTVDGTTKDCVTSTEYSTACADFCTVYTYVHYMTGTVTSRNYFYINH